MEEAKRRLLIATLDHHDGDKAAAARTLNVSLKTIYNLMRHYRITLALKVTQQ